MKSQQVTPMRSFLFTLLLSLSLLNPSFSFSTKEPLVKEGEEEVIHTREWTQQLRTSSEDRGYGVTVDSSDNIYMTGVTSGGLDGNTNSGSWDLILLKYNSSGTKQWTKQLGTSSSDSGSDNLILVLCQLIILGYREVRNSF